MFEIKVIEISTYNEGYFKAIGPDGETVTCYLHNKERDWDKLYDYLGKTILVRGSVMTRGNLIILEIC